MSASVFDSRLFGTLLSDPDVNARFSDAVQVAAMLSVEAALARALGRCGLIPAPAATAIDAAARTLQPDFDKLADSTARHGIPVIGLVETLREAAGPDHAGYVHFGATSQDVLDTALVLQLRDALELLEERLRQLCAQLADQAGAHRATVMAARTRFQQAVPMTFGVKVAGWLAPLLRHRHRLDQLRERLLVVQLGGAAGTLAAYSDQGPAVAAALAAELDLGVPPLPWHTQRDNLVECGDWLALVTGSLGKLGQDVALLSQTEIGELRIDAGGSSTMPQKRNPVKAETLVAAARMNAALIAALHQAQLHEHERGGASWQLEWMSLPQMFACTGGACRAAFALLQSLQVDAARMRANATSSGMILAEAIGFELARHLPRDEARTLLNSALADARDDAQLVQRLQQQTGLALDWAAFADPANYLGASDQFIDAVMEEYRRSR